MSTGPSEINPKRSLKVGRPDTCVKSARTDLSVLVGLLGRILRLEFPSIPTLQTIAEIKKFCCGPIELSPAPGWERHNLLYSHHSRKHAKGSKCRRRDYLTLSASLFLFRKTLPSPTPDLEAYHAKFETGKLPDEGFLRFVRQEIPRLFKPGWDKGYEGRVTNVTVCPKSFLEKAKKEETARDYARVVIGREAFKDLCRKGAPLSKVRRVAVVMKAGKARVVTVASVFQHCLAPLASMMYDHISRQEWLLRGDAKPGRFSGFVRVDGEVFVSGDYEAATDNLNMIHSREILRAVLDTTDQVSEGIREMALESIACTIQSEGRSTVMESGQLMGDKLSFPLLCLTNYLAFRYSMRCFGPSPPLRINGDDIVFRSTPAMAEHWFEAVKRSGLVVSKGKTMVDATFFSLNSNFFEASIHGKPKQVPFIRSLPLFRPSTDGSLRLGGRLRDCAVGFSPEDRNSVVSLFLRKNKGYLWRSQVSLKRGHGVRVERYILSECGLYEREQTYLSLPADLDQFPSRNRTIPGFSRVPLTRHYRRKVALSRPALVSRFVEETWCDPSEVEEPEPRGPIRCVHKTMKVGLVACGKFSWMFKDVALGRFMTPKTFHRHLDRENQKKGYIETRFRGLRRDIQWQLPLPVKPSEG